MQSLDFQREALNEHQRMLKMRGRPKILLANNFNDALKLYKKYKYNVLGLYLISAIKETASVMKMPELSYARL